MLSHYSGYIIYPETLTILLDFGFYLVVTGWHTSRVALDNWKPWERLRKMCKSFDLDHNRDQGVEYRACLKVSCVSGREMCGLAQT